MTSLRTALIETMLKLIPIRLESSFAVMAPVTTKECSHPWIFGNETENGTRIARAAKHHTHHETKMWSASSASDACRFHLLIDYGEIQAF